MIIPAQGGGCPLEDEAEDDELVHRIDQVSEEVEDVLDDVEHPPEDESLPGPERSAVTSDDHRLLDRGESSSWVLHCFGTSCVGRA